MVPYDVKQHTVDEISHCSQLFKREGLSLLIDLVIRQHYKILSETGAKEEEERNEGVGSILGGHVPSQSPAGLGMFGVNQFP